MTFADNGADLHNDLEKKKSSNFKIYIKCKLYTTSGITGAESNTSESE